MIKQHVTPLGQDDARAEFLRRVSGKRFAYYVSPVPVNGKYVPSIVVEREPGRYELDFDLGTGLVDAEAAVSEMNKNNGLTDLDAVLIVASSIGVSR